MCYVAPTIGAVITSAMWGKTKSTRIWWLTLLFWGGALFGVVDHWWNGELFLISENISGDLLLGVTITAAILVVWGLLAVMGKKSPTLANYLSIES